MEIKLKRLLVIILAMVLLSGCVKLVAREETLPTRQRSPREKAALQLTEEGRQLLDKDQPDQAIRSLEQAISLDPDNGSTHFPISIGEPDAWGDGYGTEATELMLWLAFERIGLHRVSLSVFAFNERAIRSYAKAGFQVVGFDLDENKVAAVKAGDSYIIDVTSEELSAVVQSGHLTATTDFARLAEVDSVNICVPTPLGKTRDPAALLFPAAVATMHVSWGLGFLTSSGSAETSD